MAKRVDLKKYIVPVEKLRWTCPEEIFAFKCTTDIEPLKEFIGQDRALDSINFGLAVERSGYNLFLTGLTGTGKATTIKSCLERFIAERKEKGITYQLHDWCYVYNFSAPDRPRLLKLSQGLGKSFMARMEGLLCFEQSYSGVEGDSASSTELYAILSSLSELPLRQAIAVTGSVNQKGEIQPIGGVNEKIEGFFDVCKAKGLTGDQGVMIPHQNIRNLMLREDVVKAVQEGTFHIYAVKTIDEGIEILTDVRAGKKKADGTYPEGTVNHLVDRRLKELAKGTKEYYGPASEAL